MAHFERCLQLEPDNGAVREAMRQARHTLELMGGAGMMPAGLAASVAGQAAAEAWQVAQAARIQAARDERGVMARADKDRAAQARQEAAMLAAERRTAVREAKMAEERRRLHEAQLAAKALADCKQLHVDRIQAALRHGQEKRDELSAASFIEQILVEYGCPGGGKGPWDGVGAVAKTKLRNDIINEIAAKAKTTPSGKITNALEVAQHLRAIFSS